MYAKQYDKEVGTLISDYQLTGGTPIPDALRASDTAEGPGGHPHGKLKKKIANGCIWWYLGYNHGSYKRTVYIIFVSHFNIM